MRRKDIVIFQGVYYHGYAVRRRIVPVFLPNGMTYPDDLGPGMFDIEILNSGGAYGFAIIPPVFECRH